MPKDALKRIGLAFFTLFFLLDATTASASSGVPKGPVRIHFELVLRHMSVIEGLLSAGDVSGSTQAKDENGKLIVEGTGVPIAYLLQNVGAVDKRGHSNDYIEKVLQGYPMRLQEFGVEAAEKPQTVNELLLGEAKVVKVAFENLLTTWKQREGDGEVQPPAEPTEREIQADPSIMERYYQLMESYRRQMSNQKMTLKSFPKRLSRAFVRAHELLQNFAGELAVIGIQTTFNFLFVDNHAQAVDAPALLAQLSAMKVQILASLENMHMVSHNPILENALVIKAPEKVCWMCTYYKIFNSDQIFDFELDRQTITSSKTGRRTVVMVATPMRFSKYAVYTTTQVPEVPFDYGDYSLPYEDKVTFKEHDDGWKWNYDVRKWALSFRYPPGDTRLPAPGSMKRRGGGRVDLDDDDSEAGSPRAPGKIRPESGGRIPRMEGPGDPDSDDGAPSARSGGTRTSPFVPTPAKNFKPSRNN